MIDLPDAVAFVMLVSLVLYALLAGADFGGGIWDLFARGPRANAQRTLIEKAIAPVWEANHVWLILVIVLLFTGFPSAFSVAVTALHVPLTLMVLGIVLRGSAFVFRQYGGERHRHWGRVFAVASLVTPFFLGAVLGAITEGKIHVENDVPTSGFFAPWTGPFPVAVGIFAVALFAYLAAVYLTNETYDEALARDFRARAIAAGVVVFVVAALLVPLSAKAASSFTANLLGSSWTMPLLSFTGASAIATFAFLIRGRFRAARIFAIVEVSLLLFGWGLAQRPYLVRSEVTVAQSAAPPATLVPLLIAVGAGSVLLFPSLYGLFRLFKSERGTAAGAHGPTSTHAKGSRQNARL